MRRLRSHPACRLVSAVLALLLSLGTVVGNASVALAEDAPPAVGQAGSTEPTVTVVRELPEKRTETSKHFLLSNGLRRAEIFAAPVHFKDAGGTWRDIDTRLVANLTTETVSATTTVMHYDASTQRLLNRTVAGSVVATYTFDAFGQRIAQGPTTSPTAEQFTYTGTGRLASYTSSSTTATYSYDASGQRTRSVVTEASKTTTTTYTYEGLNLLSLSAVRSDGATWSVAYLYDGQSRPYAGVYSTAATTTPFQMVTTDRGDVVELLDASGARFASYRYDDWGVVSMTATATTSAITSATVVSDIASRQPLRYAGYCYDEHSKLYYLSARSYDPLTRQFLSTDPAKADGRRARISTVAEIRSAT